MIGRKLKSILCTVFIMLGIMAVSLTLSAQPVYADDPDISASFTDANFKQAVWEWLGHSGAPGSFTKQNLTEQMGIKENTLDVSNKNIGSLAGLENFEGTGLLILNCRYNNLSSLPALPSSLNTLNCGVNHISSLPTLPGNLSVLDCSYDYLYGLPTLPGSLTKLFCFSNTLNSLPVLPNGLNQMVCSNNQLTDLPALPASLNSLNCDSNQLVSLPALPDNLNGLSCEHNQLTNLPTLPGNLTELSCGYNQLTSLPALPGNLTDLVCPYNQLTNLPVLPNGFKNLFCQSNELGSLPALPESLEELDCPKNYINVFSGELETRIKELNLTVKNVTPQYRFVLLGDALIVGPTTARQLLGYDLAKLSTDNGADWTNLYETIDIGDFTFASADKNVVRVNDSGLIEACGAGSTLIYALYNGLNTSYTAAVIIATVEEVSGANPGVVLGAVQNPLPAGAKVSISAIVMNLGDTDAAKNTVEFYIGNELIATKNVSKLKPDKSKLIKVKIVVPVDQKNMILKVKLGPVAGDVFSANNEDQSDISIMWPDLKVTSVAAKKDLVAGKSGTLTVGIYNESIATAGPFVVRVYRNGISLGEKKVSKLKPGSKTLSIKIAVPADYNPASDVLDVVVDADHQVAEENEINNTMPYPLKE